jgi:hypothetical protein
MGRASRRRRACDVCANRHPMGNATSPLASVGTEMTVTYSGSGGRPRRFTGLYRGVGPDPFVVGEVAHQFEISSQSILDIESGTTITPVGPTGPLPSAVGLNMALFPVDIISAEPQPPPQHGVTADPNGRRPN